MSSVISKSVRNVFSRRQQEIKKELTEIEKLGLKFTLDPENAAKTELELDVLDAIDDPLNDADFKIRRLYRLIVLSYKYIAVYDNPKIAPLIAACHTIMSVWSMLINEQRNAFGNFAVVDMEVPYALPNGMFQIRVERQKLAPAVFTHQYFQYMAGSEWHVEQMKRLYGKSEKNWKWLRFTPVQTMLEKVNIHPSTQRELETAERLERFANTEIIYRLFTVYSWMHREKFTFPNTPIVIQAQPQMMGGFGGKPVPTSSFIQTQDKPRDEGTPGIQTMD